MSKPSTLNPTLTNKLARHLGRGAHVDSRPEVMTTYEVDGCVLVKHPPEAVVIPETIEALQKTLAFCAQYNVPFTFRGGGTGLSGGALAAKGGIVIHLSRLNRILDLDPETRTARVQPGVVNAWINREARRHGLFFAPDPSSQPACTIGGNIAENAGGIHCAKYGMTADHILSLDWMTPDGQITRIGGSHGYCHGVDWLGVLVGSEGTLGVAVEAMVKLTPIPEQICVYLATFDRLSDATDTVSAITAKGLKPAALEFMDQLTVQAMNRAFGIGFPESSEAVLLIELDGRREQVAWKEDALMNLLKKGRASQIRRAEDEAERLKLWQARKGAVAAYGQIMPAFYLHDCVIPRSTLTEVLTEINAIGRRYDVLIGNVFHAGDGNLHPNILFDPRDSGMVQRVLAAGEAMVKVCLGVGGVLSGEHGIGLEKSGYMSLQFSESELSVMHRLKGVFDPSGLANPGKIFPTRSGCGESRQFSQQPSRQEVS